VHRRPILVGAVSAAAALLTWLLFRSGYRGVIYDSWHYLKMSEIISSEGLWNLQSRVRTYGYPLFVSVVTGFADPSPEVVRATVAAAQIVVYLAVSLYIARVSERIFDDRRSFISTYAALALNPIALIHATELLSDLLSAALVALALFVSLEQGRASRRAFLAFLACGFAVAVRPANSALLPALGLLWLWRMRRYRESVIRNLALAALAVLLALAPQLYNNVRAYEKWSPLLVDRLYAAQSGWGTAILKYGTLVIPGQEPQLVYGNPLRPEGVTNPREFLRTRPLGYLATLGLHGFALVDQDLPFTYVTNPRPWYRWPLSLANYAFLFLALAGLGLILARERRTPAGLYGIGAALFGLALVAIYLPVAVENRFSLPLYPILTPAAVHAVRWLSARRSGTILAVAIVGGGFMAACVQLSIFLTKQAPFLAGR
jgi:Alg9-like mannosyltransferase family